MNPLDDQSRPALAPGVRLQTDKVSGEPVLVFPEGVLFINSTAQDIVARCDGKTTVKQIVAALAEEYDAPEADLREDVLACLTELRRQKLLVL